MAQQEWIADAACQAHPDPSIFFPERGENGKILEAKRCCAGCPVRSRCLEDAVLTVRQFGMYGGAGEPIRRHLRRVNLNRAAREGEPTCPHPGEPSREGCRCSYCQLVTSHFERLAVTAEIGRGPSPGWNTNGPNASHGEAATYVRGCRCKQCCEVGRRAGAA